MRRLRNHYYQPIPGHRPPNSENHYCCTCRRTQAFVDHGQTLNCPLCRHELRRARTVTG